MLEVKNISFSYVDTQILKDISFALDRGKHLAVMGESGSGKSTLLKAIYGLLHLSKGAVFWNEKQLLGPNFNLIPGEKFMKHVAQDFDLMPFTTVAENIAEHLSAFNQDTHQDRVLELLQVIEMDAYAQTKVKNLSGGQQQRVALAKALAQQPEVLLLDEPFSNIDQFKKNDLRHKLFPFLKEKGITVINATHDPNDVLPFADKVLVLRNGKKITLKPTKQLYDLPKENYIAALFDLVNTVPLHLLVENASALENVLVYPHEINRTNTSGFEVYVVNNHFKGSYYLVEGLTDTGLPIFFSSKQAIDVNERIALTVPDTLIKKRISKP